MVSIRLVVARYNEDVSWTKRYANVTIYNKGLPISGYDNVINLPNVGREGHTFYTHIVLNYDNLDDFTIFLQGNPFDHTKDIFAKLDELSSNSLQNINFCYISDNILECNLVECKHHKGLPLRKVFNQLFFNGYPYFSYKFPQGAQFGVSKNRILRRGRRFYQKIINLLSKQKNPIEGFVIERFHGLIFHDLFLKGN